MTIDEKNEQIEAISKIQNQYYMDKNLSDEQKNVRGITTFLEKDNINYDWIIYNFLTSEGYKKQEEYIVGKIKETYHEKFTNMRNGIAQILDIPIFDLNFSKMECIDGKPVLTFKEKDEVKKIQIQVFSKMGKMYNDGILDDITSNFLLASVLEYYAFYENGYEIPFEQYKIMSKSK